MKVFNPTILVCAIALAAVAVDAFSSSRIPSPITAAPSKSQTSFWSGRNVYRLKAHESNDESNKSQKLVSMLSPDDVDEDEDSINNEISSLESSFQPTNDSTDTSRFDPLIGLYEVKKVLTVNKNDNPVGGKWTRSNGLAQKLFQTRATFQHLLPYNDTGLSLPYEENNMAVAEAINVISLDALHGLYRITVILRGDAVPLTSGELQTMNTNRTITPLTNLAVKAFFDPPRIFFGKRKKTKKEGNEYYSYLPLSIGPKSSVTLDTTYYDKLVRIGMGGTSGTRFVFSSTNAEESNEYKALLSQQSTGSKMKVLTTIGGILAASLYVALGSNLGADKVGLYTSKFANIIVNAKITASLLSAVKRMKPFAWVATRVVAGLTSFLSAMAMLLILFSSGGIERDGMSRSSSS